MEIDIFDVEDIMLIQQEKNAKKIEEYIRNQLKEDLEYDQMSQKENIDPYTGEQEIKEKVISPRGLASS